jgi:hypothetical protein
LTRVFPARPVLADSANSRSVSSSAPSMNVKSFPDRRRVRRTEDFLPCCIFTSFTTRDSPTLALRKNSGLLRNDVPPPTHRGSSQISPVLRAFQFPRHLSPSAPCNNPCTGEKGCTSWKTTQLPSMVQNTCQGTEAGDDRYSRRMRPNHASSFAQMKKKKFKIANMQR